jgi:hypothetical protein
MDELGGEARIRLSGPAGLLTAGPNMLGFHPTESIVLMCMNGDRNAVGPVARVDLPQGRDHGLIGRLTGTALTHADRVAVICYPRHRRRPTILDDLVNALTRAGVGIVAVLVVHAGRVWEAPTPGSLRLPDSQPVPGQHHPTAQAFAAANAMDGRVVLADRAQLRASIAGPRGDRRRLAVKAVTDVIHGHPPELPGDAGGRRREGIAAREGLPPPMAVAPLPHRVNRLVDCALEQVSASGMVDVRIAAELAVACLDRAVRDGVLVRGLFDLDRTWLAMLISCAAWTTDDLAPGICAVLAVLAYRHGDGGLAQVSVDRCLLAEPGNGLVHLLLDTMAVGLPPDVLDGLLVPPDDAALTGPDRDEFGQDGFGGAGFGRDEFGPDELDPDGWGLLDPTVGAPDNHGPGTGVDDDDAVA